MSAEYCGTAFAARVKPMGPNAAAALNGTGLIGIEARAEAIKLLGCAEVLIDAVPELASILRAVVHNIHLLKAEQGYDVSHSEPRWRASIFVSIPDRVDQTGALRLAESIVHEGMHLQLTNREQQMPMIAVIDRMMPSPWREENRPVQGVLHGLYVFSCVARFFQILTASTVLDAEGRAHVARRMQEIADDIANIDWGVLAGGLTDAGARLAKLCRSVAVRSPR